MLDKIISFLYKLIAWFGVGNRYVYFLGAATAVILIILIVLGIRKLKYKFIERIVYTREFSHDSTYAGEHVELTETIYNPTWFPLFFIDVEEFIFGGLWLDGETPESRGNSKNETQEIISRFHLMPFQQIKRHHDVYCAKRGFFEIKSVRIFRRTEPFFINAPASIHVYPEIIDANIQSFPISCLLGEYASLRRLVSDPFSFAGIREYRFGDSMSSINYKATAKQPVRSMSDIKVNARDYCTGRIFMVYLNFHILNENQTIADNYDALMEYGLSVAAAVLRDANDAGCKCGFAANCKTVDGEMSLRFPVKSGDEHTKAVLRGMAEIRPSDGMSVKYLLQKDIEDNLNNTEIIFITTYMDDEIDEKLRTLKQFTNSIAVVNIGEEDILNEKPLR